MVGVTVRTVRTRPVSEAHPARLDDLTGHPDHRQHDTATGTEAGSGRRR